MTGVLLFDLTDDGVSWGGRKGGGLDHRIGHFL